MPNYPDSIDDDSTLYLVHDSLTLKLLEDYNPGDTSITIQGDPELFARFPTSGILTLTEQCSDLTERAISFFYDGKGDNTFLDLSILSCFEDSFKAKRITTVSQSVMAEHHNVLKDGLIAIQNFVGVQGEISLTPLDGTMEARINFLRKLVLKPRAWFSTNKKIGIVPLCVNFQDFSTRSPEEWYWDFGDGTGVSIARSGSILTGDVSKCYYTPGIYNVKLGVSNIYGFNEIEIQNIVTARVEAPDLATIEFTPTSDQILSDDEVLRTRIERPVSIEVTDTGEQALDPVVRVIWDLQDDLPHDTSTFATASYSIGGSYDVKVRIETELGAYRITSFEDVIDVVERFNIWHFIFDSDSNAATKTLNCYEFGLLSELYKSAMPTTTTVTRNYNFLSGKTNDTQQIREFRRNNGFAPTSLANSGDRGVALLYWAEGAATDSDSQNIKFVEFNGFDQAYYTPVIDGGSDVLSRYWNWIGLNSTSQVHFLLGLPGAYPQPVGSPVDLDMDTLFLADYSITTSSFVPASDFVNGAIDLVDNPDNGVEGDFSVYRSAWHGQNGYFIRNDAGGTFFRLKSFYKTESTGVGSEVDVIRKLPDMGGSTKFEGQLVSLSGGLYFFNNSGEVVAYDPVANIWGSGGPGLNSPAFSQLQDKTVVDYDKVTNTLIACSDGDRRAYLFYDYSTSANLIFNEVDKTFRRLPARPSGEQFVAGLY